MNANPSVLSKLPCGVLIISLTITTLLIITGLRVSYINKLRDDKSNFYDGLDNNYYDDYASSMIKITQEKVGIATQIKHKIRKINEEQAIHNQDRFGAVKRSTYVIVIQLHYEIRYLEGLLHSLKHSMGITNSLLVFSHEFYDDNVNHLIRNISFAKYTQIFYPYSSQLYPNSFPGDDCQLCLNDFNCEKSVFRSESLVQRKHFWWWQTNYVFDRLRALDSYDGYILFLEENQYVLRDFVFMLKVIESMMETGCPNCEIISLGAYHPDIKQFHAVDGNLTLSFWSSTTSNRGLAFNKTLWNTIKHYSYHFCNFNDYQWDVSLKYLGLKRPQGQFRMMVSAAPRVFEFNKCDGYVYCTLEDNINEAKDFAKSVDKGLFPRNIIINTSDETDVNLTAAGSWEDVRDIGLCMSIVKN